VAILQLEFIDIIVVARVIGCDVLGGEEIACMFLFYVKSLPNHYHGCPFVFG
jgi:hypothetical protein